MKRLFQTLLLLLFGCSLFAQQNNPLINSGQLIEQAQELVTNGKYKDAITIYQTIRTGDTNYARALYGLAYTQMADSQFAVALQTCKAGLSWHNETWPEFYTLYGNIVDDMGDPKRALVIYDSAILLYPTHSELYLNKGTTLMRMQQYEAASKVFIQGVLINPFLASAHSKLGLCAALLGKPVHAFLSHLNYLLLQPSGRHYARAIAELGKLSSGDPEIRDSMQARTIEPSDHFQLLEKILLSKIALDKQYKPMLKLDDQISRQAQVIFEKLEYDEQDQDFWMQYYVPLFKQIFTDGQFGSFVYRAFSNVNIPVIQDHIKKNKKEIDDVITVAANYCTQIRNTRILNYVARKDRNAIYHFDNGVLVGKGETKDNGDKLSGYWEFYYTPGNMKSKGNYDDQGSQTGKWVYYHFNGNLKGTQVLLAGKNVGEEVFYHENGLVSSKASYVNGEAEGKYSQYTSTGAQLSELYYRKSMLHGERKNYYPEGNLQGIENYVNDTLHGPFITYHQSGSTESKGNYQRGELEGKYISYFENGKVASEGIYSKNLAEGPWTFYHDNGKVKVKETLVKGVIEGEYTEYHANGNLSYTAKYSNNELTGDVDYMDRDGKRNSRYTLDKSIMKKAVYFDKAGKEISVSEFKGKKLDLTTYFPDGFKRSTALYNDKNEIQGSESYYYRSGKLSSTYHYIDGKYDGPAEHFHPNGKLQYNITYKAGEKHGYEKFWYPNGKLQEEGWYQNDMIEGTRFSYNEQGALTVVADYLHNETNGIYTEYFPTGRKERETRHINGLLGEITEFDSLGKQINHVVLKNGNGKVRQVFVDGTTLVESNYKYGKLDGNYKTYFFNGKPSVVQFYKYGMPDSAYKGFYYNGQLGVDGKYQWGKKAGSWKSYYLNGKLNNDEIYVNGKLHGKKISYYENGKIDAEVEYEYGEIHGITKKYDIDGQLMYQIRFAEELPLSYSYLDKSGKLLPEIPFIGGSGKLISYFQNGKIAAEFEYADGKLHGMNKNYYSSGALRSQGVENYSISEGRYDLYHQNGKVKGEYNYNNNHLHGFYKEFNDRGILTEEGYYYNGLPHDQTKKYDDNGKLTETLTYYYGRLIALKK